MRERHLPGVIDSIFNMKIGDIREKYLNYITIRIFKS